MTREEIIERVTMYDLLKRYNIPTRRKKISCIFHGADKNPSMQIFKDGFKCHTCGESGNIFSFVQQMEHCDFKTAFTMLGGTYTYESDTQRNFKLYKLQKEKEKREFEELKRKKELNSILKDINLFQGFTIKAEPLSDNWCWCMNKLEYLFGKLEYLNGK